MTTLGADFLAGLRHARLHPPATVHPSWQTDASFTPQMDADTRAQRMSDWRRAVERARAWVPA